MEIKIIKENKKQFLDLLLLADESEAMIDKYLERGEMFALYDHELRSICVVTSESPDTCELKNIATYEKWHGMGYGSKLIQHVSSFYKDKYKYMIVGTGDVPTTVTFYEKNDFRLYDRIRNFFKDNYDHPIFEDGVQLVDMVYLKKALYLQQNQNTKPTTIGILAGMGPRSTSPFLESVLDECQSQYGAKYDLDYPHIIVYSLPTPFYIDREIDETALSTAIKDGLERLEVMGADLVAIPCNSAHAYFNQITQGSKMPVLNIIDETLKGITEGSVITVFATELTMKTQLYQEGILRHHCQYAFDESWQSKINAIILRIKNQEDHAATLEMWLGLIDEVKNQKIDTIVLACTDLNVLNQSDQGILFLDSSKILAKRLVARYLEVKDGLNR